MTRDEALDVLRYLAEQLPEHAPDMNELVLEQWHDAHLRTLDHQFARRVIDRLAATWDKPHWPRPGEFNAVRSDIEIRDRIAAAKAAVAGAPDLPRI